MYLSGLTLQLAHPTTHSLARDLTHQEECMRTWIPRSTIGTAVIARNRLYQLLQSALVAHLLALVDGGHVCSSEVWLDGPLFFLQELLACRRGWLEVLAAEQG